MSRRKPQSAAVLTIQRPGQMNVKGRRMIAAWLRDQAAHFQGYGWRYSKTRFTARYMY